MTRQTIILTLIVAWVAAAIGTQALAQGAGNAAEGKKLFVDSGEDLDYPSCAHCHATVSAAEELAKTGHIKPAFPVFNSAHRGAWKNKKAGKVATAGDAGNFCVKAFQKRKKFKADKLAHVNAYLATLSPSTTIKPRKINYKPKLPESLDGGDAIKGQKAVQIYCGACHGASDDHLQFELRPGKKAKLKIAMKVRGWVRSSKAESGRVFNPAKGQMSFFAKDRLSDETLLDILAYLGK